MSAIINYTTIKSLLKGLDKEEIEKLIGECNKRLSVLSDNKTSAKAKNNPLVAALLRERVQQ